MAYSVLNAPSRADGLLGGITAPWLDFVPILGWMVGFFNGLLFGMSVQAWICALLLIASSIGALVYIFRTEVDYYEDAMGLAIETAEKLKKQKDAQFKTTRPTIMRKVKSESIRNHGIGKGRGTAAIFWRQILSSNVPGPILWVLL